MADAARLADPAVEARLARLDEVLAGLEAMPGPALEAVALLTEVYGEALARVLDRAEGPLRERLAEDELLGHLLVLHDIHPEPPERRAARAVEKLRPAVRERGGELEWAGLEGQVARVRLKSGGGGCGSGCGSGGGSGSSDVTEAVRAAVLAVAPELTSVETVEATPKRVAAPAFVPLTSIRRRPVAQETP
ncbi:NifU family protein [Streptomyces sp. NPDC028722]|uniref:NifU family protein n=1 Tax=Streptomyces sp. NPDC028722 TaxID=3155016 RepID=UPI003409DDE5